MNLREEVTGLFRSIGYDVRRRIGWGADDAYPEYDAYSKRSRPVLLAGGIAGLAVAGVAGTYFALAGGLGGMLLGTVPTGANPAAPPQTPVVTSATPTAGTTRSTTAPTPTPSRGGLPPVPITNGPIPAGQTGASPTPSQRAKSSPSATPSRTPTPPVTSPSASASPSPSPSASPTSGDPTPSDSPSASTSDEASTVSFPGTDKAEIVPAVQRTESTIPATGA
ncbi:MAG TPA: hypothetical protein VGJ28_02110 [Micromonosporaceae bacterium]